jgi:hypothetical protein
MFGPALAYLRQAFIKRASAARHRGMQPLGWAPPSLQHPFLRRGIVRPHIRVMQTRHSRVPDQAKHCGV